PIAALAGLALGLRPDAAALAGFLIFFAAMFQHLNVRTPQWIGWIVQRPEAHSVHHARGVHAYNYGNFMLWDIVLGTFRNPASFTEQQGFWDGASTKFGSMLVGRDVAERNGS
ncbi:MAG TPA: sterol desaturase family protein, partial [Labilithrix sp.]